MQTHVSEIPSPPNDANMAAEARHTILLSQSLSGLKNFGRNLRRFDDLGLALQRC